MTYPELKIGDLTVKKPIIQGGMGRCVPDEQVLPR